MIQFNEVWNSGIILKSKAKNYRTSWKVRQGLSCKVDSRLQSKLVDSSHKSLTKRKWSTASCFAWEGRRGVWRRQRGRTYRSVCPAITWASRRTAPQATRRRESSTPTSPKSCFISRSIKQIFQNEQNVFIHRKIKESFYISVELWSNNDVTLPEN
jgi:hypothetical protein